MPEEKTVSKRDRRSMFLLQKINVRKIQLVSGQPGALDGGANARRVLQKGRQKRQLRFFTHVTIQTFPNGAFFRVSTDSRRRVRRLDALRFSFILRAASFSAQSPTNF
jgi:hypothetical protein